MSELSLLVDGMLSGTGIRDAANGGYLEPHEIGLSDVLARRISMWLSAYEDAHFHQYNDQAKNEALDREGIEIAQAVRAELPTDKVGYFSNANMREIKF
jgi:hypothetical protein